MRGPVQAALLSAAFAYSGLMFAPSLVLAGAIVALVVLRHGFREGLKASATATLVVASLAYLTFGKVGLSGLVVIAPWAPLGFAARRLRASGNQGGAVALLGLFVGCCAATIRYYVPDVDGFWQSRLEGLGEAVKAQGGQFLTREEIATFAGLVHPGTIAALVFCLVGALLLARWWQSELYRPGAFALEFRVFDLPRWVIPAALAAGLAAVALHDGEGGKGLAGDVGLVLVLVYAVQGLAIAHERVAATGGKRWWLVGLYAVLGVLPHVALTTLAAAGAADLIADFRQLRRPSKPND